MAEDFQKMDQLQNLLSDPKSQEMIKGLVGMLLGTGGAAEQQSHAPESQQRAEYERGNSYSTQPVQQQAGYNNDQMQQQGYNSQQAQQHADYRIQPMQQQNSAQSQELHSQGFAGMDENMQTIAKIKQIYDGINTQNDPRVNLLMAIKPYLNSKRSVHVDTAVKMMQLTKMTSLMNIFDK